MEGLSVFSSLVSFTTHSKMSKGFHAQTTDRPLERAKLLYLRANASFPVPLSGPQTYFFLSCGENIQQFIEPLIYTFDSPLR